MNILVYDTETTGLPDWKNPSEGETQPHLVEICGLLYDAESQELVDSYHAIIKPDGWMIPQEVIDVHGITNERAVDEGVPEAEAVSAFLTLDDRAELRVAHNQSFDARIMRIAIKRYGAGDTQEERDVLADLFRAGESYCTCNKSKPIVQLPATEKMVASGRGHWFKPPNMQEAHEFFLGVPFEDAHSARADAEACARVYFAIQQRQPAEAA